MNKDELLKKDFKLETYADGNFFVFRNDIENIVSDICKEIGIDYEEDIEIILQSNEGCTQFQGIIDGEAYDFTEQEFLNIVSKINH